MVLNDGKYVPYEGRCRKELVPLGKLAFMVHGSNHWFVHLRRYGQNPNEFKSSSSEPPYCFFSLSNQATILSCRCHFVSNTFFMSLVFYLLPVHLSSARKGFLPLFSCSFPFPFQLEFLFFHFAFPKLLRTPFTNLFPSKSIWFSFSTSFRTPQSSTTDLSSRISSQKRISFGGSFRLPSSQLQASQVLVGKGRLAPGFCDEPVNVPLLGSVLWVERIENPRDCASAPKLWARAVEMNCTAIKRATSITCFAVYSLTRSSRLVFSMGKATLRRHLAIKS